MRHQDVEERAGQRIAAIAAMQGGVVGVRQLSEAGLDGSAVHRRVESGWLHPVHRGVYAVGHPAIGAQGRWRAAVLACGEGAVLSHASAAAAWDLVPIGAGRVHVTVTTPGGRTGHRGVVVHRVTTLAPEHTTMEGLLPITTPERTLLDLAAVSRLLRVERALEQAEALRLVDHAVLAELAASRRPGVRLLRAALAEPPTVTRSVLERRFLALCRRHEIPRPRVNVRVGAVEVDFLWPERRLIAETDGARHHLTRRSFERDRQRDAQLTAAGFRVVRFTHRQVVDDAAGVAAILRRLLARREDGG